MASRSARSCRDSSAGPALGGFEPREQGVDVLCLRVRAVRSRSSSSSLLVSGTIASGWAAAQSGALLATSSGHGDLQALLTLISRSAGKILNAIFGWAVRALFGQPLPREQPFLTGVVAAAAAWPVLLLALALPKIGARCSAFAPFHNRVPTLVSGSCGWAWRCSCRLRGPGRGVEGAGRQLREPFYMRARAAGRSHRPGGRVLVMFVTVPALKVAALARRRLQEEVPLVTALSNDHDVAVLDLHHAQSSWLQAGVGEAELVDFGADDDPAEDGRRCLPRLPCPTRLEYFRRRPARGGARSERASSCAARAARWRARTASCRKRCRTRRRCRRWTRRRRRSRAHPQRLGAVRFRAPHRQRRRRTLCAPLRSWRGSSRRPTWRSKDWQILYRELMQLDRELSGREPRSDGRRPVHATRTRRPSPSTESPSWRAIPKRSMLCGRTLACLRADRAGCGGDATPSGPLRPLPSLPAPAEAGATGAVVADPIAGTMASRLVPRSRGRAGDRVPDHAGRCTGNLGQALDGSGADRVASTTSRGTPPAGVLDFRRLVGGVAQWVHARVVEGSVDRPRRLQRHRRPAAFGVAPTTATSSDGTSADLGGPRAARVRPRGRRRARCGLRSTATPAARPSAVSGLRRRGRRQPPPRRRIRPRRCRLGRSAEASSRLRANRRRHADVERHRRRQQLLGTMTIGRRGRPLVVDGTRVERSPTASWRATPPRATTGNPHPPRSSGTS